MIEGKVSVETGTILMIDPGFLFTPEQWLNEVVPLAKKNRRDKDKGWGRAILSVLSKGKRHDLSKLATVIRGGPGDGTYKVRRIGEPRDGKLAIEHSST